ncbi:MAG TPA: efflux RND transporter permease subunit [Candidatus Hydrogenedens sp.]|nr:efflux RND transporter permease subunit [Candidatus Hydrogenedens sp.]
MNLIELSVRRPVAVTCLFIGLTFLGIEAYYRMGLEFFPKVDVPYVTVVTVYPGASPEEIETDIARRIEDAVFTIDGLKHVTSNCMENVCQTFLEFQLNVDVDVAAYDVREKLDLIQNDFPEGTEKPKVLKFDINAVPIIDLALTGDIPIDELYDYADNQLKDKLTTIEGVANVELVGGAKKEVHVLLDRDKLASRGLTSLDIVEAIQKGVRLIPSGRVREGETEYSVKYDAEYHQIEQLETLPIISKEGSRCYIKDIGKVVFSSKEIRQSAFLDGKSCIYIRIVKRAEANTVRVVESVRSAIGNIQSSLPVGMELVWVNDEGSFIKATVDSTTGDIIQGIILTALILFFFLYNFRLTFIVGITMPLTIVVGLFFISLLGYSLNISTLISLGLSVGILVTNSIVVLESIMTEFQKSQEPKESAIKGASRVFIAVLASAGTNLVVLFPIATMGSQVGLFLAPFAWTMIIVTAVSLFISFTMTPLLASILLKSTKKRGIIYKFEQIFNMFLDFMKNGYIGVLKFFEHRRLTSLLFTFGIVVIFILTFNLIQKIGFGFFEEPDRGTLFIRLEYPTHYSLKNTIKRVKEVEERVKDLPYLKHVLSSVGKIQGIMGQTSEGVYVAQILLVFNEKPERPDMPIDKIKDKVRKLLENYPDCKYSVGSPTAIGGQSIPIELEIFGEDREEIQKIVKRLETQAKSLEGLKDIDTSIRGGRPELKIYPDKPLLSDINFPPVILGMLLRGNLEGITAGVYKQQGRNYDIVVKFDEIEGKQQVENFLLPGAPGKPINLTTVAKIEEKTAPVNVLRKDKRKIEKLFAGLAPRKPLGTAVAELTDVIKKYGNLPQGYDYYFFGENEVMVEAQQEFARAGIIAIVLIILVLAAILESFKQPFFILVTLPLGLIGVVLSLYLTGYSISMFVLLGLVMLSGIVVNNAILIIDRLNQLVASGVSRHKAMIQSAGEQFRPILMITLAAVAGMIPIATGKGLGSEIRTDLGIASIGGIAFSGVLTLIVIPVLYDLFTRGKIENNK